MPKATKKILCYIAIISILNLSFQPAYAGKFDLPLMSEEMSYTQRVSHHLTHKSLYKERMSDLGLEDPQAHATNIPQAPEDVVSWLFLAPLKTMIGAVSLVREGVRFALENPGKAMTMGLLLQARTATSTLSLSGLTPNQGFNINGTAAGDLSGYSVSSAGDFNGDGRNDLIIGAPYANNFTGNSYVIYGTNSAPSLISLSSLTPLQGFIISGASANDYSGWSVSSAGDFNGDGLYDLIIGAYGANNGAGKSYLIYGTNSTPSLISLFSLTPAQGFAINGTAAGDQSGYSVSSAGDFNGDGLNDVIIGAPQGVGVPNNSAGKGYVIYGTKTLPSSISLFSLTPAQGFAINGTAAGDLSGRSVSSAGDFNGDGLNDVIIGAPNANSEAGMSYVIYGTKIPLSSISFSSLTPLQGFAIIGAVELDLSGFSVSSAGDFNGDVLNDVIIGSYRANSLAGKSYIIYGTNSTPSSLSLFSLTSLQGFTITGAAAGDRSGWFVFSAGDFNGDGLNDVIIGAPYANYDAGNSYVIYGTNSKPSSISLFSLTAAQGLTISGAAVNDYSGFSVSSAGDFSGDGRNDVIIGAPSANTYAGKSYVIYGAPSPSPQSSSETGESGTSWKTYASIGGGIGGAVLISIAGGVIAKKYCCSKRNKPGGNYSILAQDDETLAIGRVLSPFPFAPKSSGFTEHPTFVGTLQGDTYEIWKTLSQEEAELLRPLTAMTVPDSGNVSFTLGQGNFGATYAGSNQQTHEICAIKEVHGTDAVEESLREGKIVHSLGDHPHIMPLIDYMHFKPSEGTQEPRLLQVMSLAYINGTGFREMLSFSKDDQRERIVSDSFRQMMMGLDYIHGQGVVHLDIKSDNTLYMKDGTLRIADYGRAKEVGDNDQIADPYSGLGDMRKFSPEIIALFRNNMGGNGDIPQSLSGKAADIWAAGLYIWELLEDDTSNLFSTKSIPLRTRVITYTYGHFEKLLENIDSLKRKFSLPLLNLLHQVLTVDPHKRIRPPQIIKQLSSSAMTPNRRRMAFEELISLNSEIEAAVQQALIPVYQPADPTQYIPREADQQQFPAYVAAGLYPGGLGQVNDNAGQMNPVFSVSQGE